MVRLPTPQELAEMEAQQQAQAESMHLSLSHAEVDGLTGEETVIEQDINHSAGDVIAPPESRNAPCPCGSGLKYKQCHGKI